MKNIIIALALFSICVSATHVRTPNNPDTGSNIDKRLEYLLGDWQSTGFVTDAEGLNQYIEINQHIEVKGNDLQFTIDGINPYNGYRYKTTKTIFYDPQKQTWHVKGTVKDRYSLNNKVYITDVNTVTYTFYDDENNLMRYSIIKENDNTFVETEEKWTTNGWDKTAWLRMQRALKALSIIKTPKGMKGQEVTDRPVHE